MKSDSAEAVAPDVIAALFSSDSWDVVHQPDRVTMPPDLVVSKGSLMYAVEIKTISEGRADRVIPLLAQAILQAQAHARDSRGVRPLAIVHVGNAERPLLDKVQAFSSRFAPDVAIGVIANDGTRHFIGPGLASLNVAPARTRKQAIAVPHKASDLFSDLNQWMLKVLLAPEIPEHLLAAPRARYEHASQLAVAAGVSVMTASRFVNRMREEGFLDDVAAPLQLVRRTELFRRWQSAALRSSPEMRMCFLNPGASQAQLYKAVSRHQACLGLFAAADALGVGHVSGVPPYVYVRKLPRSEQDLWRELIPARPGGPADLILRQAAMPQSILRGAVNVDGMMVTDVLQVWLDVVAHPSRGPEQADFLGRTVLRDVIGEAS